ncbi:DUF2867 domain-containing protein [Roseibium sp. HPY-6]|uniref:DUF2867 domain-containing protein n=1 Tax=Roseibium sp. HPY-6 TaxID=3229852 RepID=UPI003390757A
MSVSDTLPNESVLHTYYSPRDYLDVFSVSLEGRPDLQEVDIRVLADHMLMADIGWMNALLSLRDKVVKPLGLKTTDDLALEQSDTPVGERQPGDRIGFFRIFRVSDNEIILGEDDWHQDFRLSLFRRQGDRPRVYASTCCKRHNLFGHAYLALILPFHKKIASTVLDNAVAQKMTSAA